MSTFWSNDWNNKASIKFRNNNINLYEGQKLASDSKKLTDIVVSRIFDTVEKNNKLDSIEFQGAKEYSSGVFDSNNDASIITYKEKGYSSKWYFNKEGTLIKRVKDRNGDGKTDFVEIKTNSGTQFIYDEDYDGKLDAFVFKQDKDGNIGYVIATNGEDYEHKCHGKNFNINVKQLCANAQRYLEKERQE